MTRLIKPFPTPNRDKRVYDPCVGSGGMLILSKQYVEEHGGDTKRLYLYGQDDNGNAWTICKMNMILHGVKNAQIVQGDTLLKPGHKDAMDELMHFDYVISNPPFSQNYKKDEMEDQGRFKFFCPQTGKKADLMFAQHMLAVLRHEGMIATVMPHGVLFRGGVEKQIREDFIKRDVLEAVIGLPSNLFYGTGIPACILVMRYEGCKPPERKGKVLFINADLEHGEKGPKSILRPEDIEKIVTTFEEFRNVDGYATVVTHKELADKEYNLNIRRYADNTPPPEPQDVRAHLHGGIPRSEVTAKADLLAAHGLPVNAIFVDRDERYYDFVPVITERRAIKTFLLENKEMQAQEACLRSAFTLWWQQHLQHLRNLPSTQALIALRSDFLNTFNAALVTVNLLDRYKIAGVIASWWNESQYDLRTIANQGFPGLIDSWISTIHTTLEDPKDGKREKSSKERRGLSYSERLDFILSHKLLVRLLPDYIQQIAETRDTIADLEQQKEAFERGELNEQEEEDEALEENEVMEEGAGEERTRNYARELEKQIELLDKEIYSRQLRIKELKRRLKSSSNGKNGAQSQTLFADLLTPEAELASLEAEIAPTLQEIAVIEKKLAPYYAIKNQLSAARKQQQEQINNLLVCLDEVHQQLSPEECERYILEITRDDISSQLERYIIAHRQLVIAAIENWWDKYHVTLMEIEEKRDKAAVDLKQYLRGLEYL